MMEKQTIVTTIGASSHGRYLVAPPAASGPAPLLVGFHGYGESAEIQLERLRAIAPDGGWLIVSVQGLHRFYRGRTQEVVAGWMTSQDRELAIADNIGYVHAVVDAVVGRWPVTSTLVFSGFSQGVAMAFRAAATSVRPVRGAIVCGGDVPPEIDRRALSRLPAVLVARGVQDDWYSPGKLESDVTRLAAAGVNVTPLEFDGGHEWAPPFVDAAQSLLQSWR